MAINDGNVIVSGSVTDQNTQQQQQQNTNQSQLQQLASNTQAGTQNQYTAGQTALQNLATSQLGNYFMSNGNISPTWGVPQAVWDQSNYMFQRDQAPQLAAQFGAGSPVIGARQNELNLGLAAIAGQQMHQNFMGALSPLLNAAYQPVGTQSFNNNTQNQQSQMQQQQNQNLNSNTDTTQVGTTINPGGLLGSIASFLGGGF